MILCLPLVVLERVEDLRVVGRRDHPVEQAEDALLYRVRFVDVLDQLRRQLIHVVQPPQSELSDLTPEQQRMPAIPTVLRLELVDEHRERRLVVELETAHFERQSRKARELR